MTVLFLQFFLLMFYHAVDMWLVLYIHGLQRQTARSNCRVYAVDMWLVLYIHGSTETDSKIELQSVQTAVTDYTDSILALPHIVDCGCIAADQQGG